MRPAHASRHSPRHDHPGGRGHHLDLPCRSGPESRRGRGPRRHPAGAARLPRRHLAVLRGDGRPGHRAAGRQHRRRPQPGHPQRVHLAHQHRRLPVGDGRGPRHRADRRGEARERMRQTIQTVAGLEKHEPSGMFYNWYDPETGAKLTTWPENGDPVYPFASSVDNGWLATGLLVAARADQEGRRPPRTGSARPWTSATTTTRPRVSGRTRPTPPPRSAARSAAASGSSRRATAPATRATTAAARTSTTPATTTARSTPSPGWRPTSASRPGRSRSSTTSARCAPSRRPVTVRGSRPGRPASGASYLGVDVFEGTLPYRGLKLVPTWGGSMFEALMVPLFVPEETWGPRRGASTTRCTCGPRSSTASTRPATATGASRRPTTPPAATASTAWTRSAWTPPATPPTRSAPTGTSPSRAAPTEPGEPAPTSYGDGVVTPHASFLALRYAPEAALANLSKLREHFDVYGPGRVLRRGRGAQRDGLPQYLALDQGMIIAALGNELTGDDLRALRLPRRMEHKLRPLMAMESFTSEAGH